MRSRRLFSTCRTSVSKCVCSRKVANDHTRYVVNAVRPKPISSAKTEARERWRGTSAGIAAAPHIQLPAHPPQLLPLVWRSCGRRRRRFRWRRNVAAGGAFYRYCSINTTFSPVENLAVRIDKFDRRIFRREMEMHKAGERTRKRSAVVTFHRAQNRAAATGDKERRRPVGDLQVFEIVVVTAQIKVDFVRENRRRNRRDHLRIVTVQAIGKKWMMRRDDDPFFRIRALYFRVQPRFLGIPFVRAETVAIAIDDQHADERRLFRKINAIPFRWQLPTRVGVIFPVCKLGLELRAKVLVIVVAKRDVKRKRQCVARIHLLEFRLPARIIFALRKWSVKIVAQQQTRLWRDVTLRQIIAHRMCNSPLLQGARAPVAKRDEINRVA